MFWFFFRTMTVSMATKRFYVGNLSKEIKEADLEKLFKKFGPVETVNIKTKSDIDGNVLTTFAFVTLNSIAEETVIDCIQKLNNSVWKKQTIKVQQAQESFLSRLQRERDEAAKPIESEQVTKKSQGFSQDYDPMGIVKKQVTNIEPKLKRKELPQDYLPMEMVKKVKLADEKEAVSFDDDSNLGDGSKVNALERQKSVRVYHSSSDEDEDETYTKRKKAKKPVSKDILKKLEDFDGGFWKDEQVILEHIPTLKETKNTVEDNVAFKEPQGQGFSLLSTFGVVKDEPKKEEENQVSDAFAIALKEKALAETNVGEIEHFFFAEDDTRFKEAEHFLHLKESMSEVRSKYEEKRPILASIMKKKMKNRAKRREKVSFGTKKRKFVSKSGKKSNK